MGMMLVSISQCSCDDEMNFSICIFYHVNHLICAWHPVHVMSALAFIAVSKCEEGKHRPPVSTRGDADETASFDLKSGLQVLHRELHGSGWRGGMLPQKPDAAYELSVDIFVRV